MKIVCRLLVAMAILTVGLVQVSLAAEFNPVWDAGGDAFWFQRQGVDGSSYIAVDPLRRSQKAAFDHARLATELSRLSEHAVDAQHLELTQLSIDQSKGLFLREVKSDALNESSNA